jgi:hypothetical protein
MLPLASSDAGSEAVQKAIVGADVDHVEARLLSGLEGHSSWPEFSGVKSLVPTNLSIQDST